MTIDEARVKLDTAKEIVRLSELYIDGTIRFSLAADSRAMQLSGVLAACACSCKYGFLFTNGTIDYNHFAMGTAMIAAAISFVLALRHSLSAAAPRRFHVNGNYLNKWSSDEDLYGSLCKAMIGQARVYQYQIDENNQVLRSNASKINSSLKLMGLAPLLAFGTGIVAYFSFDKFDKLLTVLQVYF